MSNDSINHENSSCGITPSIHVARVFVATITEAFEESFSFDEFETSVIENVAADPIFVGKVAKPRAKFLTRQKLVNLISFCSSLRAPYSDYFGCYINNRRVKSLKRLTAT